MDLQDFFDNASRVREEKEQSTSWLGSFLKLKHIWRNEAYLNSCLPKAGEHMNSLALFGSLVKKAYTTLCIREKRMTPDELRNVIIVMVNEMIPFNYSNIENVHSAIQQGFYTSYLESVKKKHKLEEEVERIVNEIDWGDF